MGNIFSVLGVIGILAFGVLQLVVGFHGLEVQFGTMWAYIGAGLAFLRFTPPLMVGAYFGAIDLWGWHPVLAVIFAAPALLILIPGIITAVIEAVRK
jgi:hypothetical protein